MRSRIWAGVDACLPAPRLLSTVRPACARRSRPDEWQKRSVDCSAECRRAASMGPVPNASEIRPRASIESMSVPNPVSTRETSAQADAAACASMQSSRNLVVQIASREANAIPLSRTAIASCTRPPARHTLARVSERARTDQRGRRSSGTWSRTASIVLRPWKASLTCPALTAILLSTSSAATLSSASSPSSTNTCSTHDFASVSCPWA